VCGRPAKKQSEQAEVLEDRLCPACNAAMLLVSIADFSAIGCKACSGLFLTHETFEMMQDSQQRVIESTRAGSPTAAIGATRITYVRCPVCRTLMNRKNFAAGSGVILDVCGRHGTWFDGGELEKIMDFIARGGLAKARAIELEEKKHELYLQRLRKETPEPGGFDPGICEPSSSILTGGGSDLFVDLVGGLIKILKNH
jgi:Zn-finger nucleic acid-binding protein